MKSQKLVNEFNELLESIVVSQHERKKVLQAYFQQVQKKEKKLRKSLKNVSCKASERAIRKELGMVKKAYTLLGY